MKTSCRTAVLGLLFLMAGAILLFIGLGPYKDKMNLPLICGLWLLLSTMVWIIVSTHEHEE
jgi:uncharacterized membrane protein